MFCLCLGTWGLWAVVMVGLVVDESCKHKWAPPSSSSSSTKINATQHNTTQVPLSAEQTADGKWVLVSDAQTHVKLDAAAAGQQ